MIVAKYDLAKNKFNINKKLYQYDYGQVLRIEGMLLPTAIEIDFSLHESGGKSESNVGVTKDGVTDVRIPDVMLENKGVLSDYFIYAFIYLTDETSGQTVYKIRMSVIARPERTDYSTPDPSHENMFQETITAVNEAADRAEEAAKKEVTDGRIDTAVTEYLDENGIKTDKTLTVDGGIADAKATGNELKKKANKENPVFTGSISMGRKTDTTVGDGSVAIGHDTTASDRFSHAEGENTSAFSHCSHAEGYGTKAFGECSHAEGLGTTASSSFSHAEGLGTKASSNCSHAEGRDTSALGNCSHAEGYSNKVSGDNSHAEGSYCEVSNSNSHAEGYGTKVFGNCSHTEGNSTTASGNGSHAEGLGTKALGNCSHVQGKFNIEDTENKYAHIVGNGTGESNKTNAHTLDWQGNAWYKGSVTSSGADYAEFFEWLDGNTGNEDRVGLLVTLDGEKIRLAESGDEILGIISGTAAVLGDNYECEWNGKYLTDDFGRVIYDAVEEFIDVPVGINEETREPITEKQSVGFFKHPRVNPNYDPEQKYINRAERPEWDTVGMLGKLYLHDDGTCAANGYVTVGENGIGTASRENTNMRVLSRVSENVIRVLLK